MATTGVRNISSWVLAILLALAYLIAAAGKLTGAATPLFENWGYAPWFAMLIGVLELAGGIGLLIPRLTRLAILGLTGLMVGAAYTHLAAGEGLQVLRPVVFTAVLWILWWLRGDAARSSDGS